MITEWLTIQWPHDFVSYEQVNRRPISKNCSGFLVSLTRFKVILSTNQLGKNARVYTIFSFVQYCASAVRGASPDFVRCRGPENGRTTYMNVFQIVATKQTCRRNKESKTNHKSIKHQMGVTSQIKKGRQFGKTILAVLDVLVALVGNFRSPAIVWQKFNRTGWTSCHGIKFVWHKHCTAIPTEYAFVGGVLALINWLH